MPDSTTVPRGTSEPAKKRQCFTIFETQRDEHGFIPSLVTEGEPGHSPLMGHGEGATPWYWGDTIEAAQKTCASVNLERYGLSEKDAAAIVLSSMFQGPVTPEPTIETQTRVTLKNVKYAAFASEETACFEASVYFDGKRVGSVRNEGHGGCDYETVTDRDGWAAMMGFIETLSDYVDDDADYRLEADLELVCSHLLNAHLDRKEWNNRLRGKIMYYTGKWEGKYRFIPTKGHGRIPGGVPEEAIRNHILKKAPGAIILNDLSDAERFALSLELA